MLPTIGILPYPGSAAPEHGKKDDGGGGGGWTGFRALYSVQRQGANKRRRRLDRIPRS
jgi:hypothetical protein